MNRRDLTVFFFFLALAVSRQGTGFQKPAEENEAFRWLDATGETTGIKYVTHRLSPISLQTETGPPVKIETDEKQIDSQTTRISRRAFTTSVNGTQQLAETTIEEIKRMPGGRIQAVRTVSRPDANGRISTVRKEIQEMTAAGADTYRITRTLLLPGANNSLEQKEQITQVEKRRGEKSVEIDRTRYLPGLNGAWNVVERRVSQNNVGTDRSQTDEQVYTHDINNQLSLNQQVKITESRDSAGRLRLQSESYAPDIDGGIQLSQRLTIVQTALRDGRQETTQTLEKPGPASSREGLRLVRKVVENLQVLGPNETERQLEVLEPDLNGGLRTLDSWQTLENKR